jgi:hypothetical protein
MQTPVATGVCMTFDTFVSSVGSVDHYAIEKENHAMMHMQNAHEIYMNACIESCCQPDAEAYNSYIYSARLYGYVEFDQMHAPIEQVAKPVAELAPVENIGKPAQMFQVANDTDYANATHCVPFNLAYAMIGWRSRECSCFICEKDATALVLLPVLLVVTMKYNLLYTEVVRDSRMCKDCEMKFQIPADISEKRVYANSVAVADNQWYLQNKATIERIKINCREIGNRTVDIKSFQDETVLDYKWTTYDGAEYNILRKWIPSRTIKWQVVRIAEECKQEDCAAVKAMEEIADAISMQLGINSISCKSDDESIDATVSTDSEASTDDPIDTWSTCKNRTLLIGRIQITAQ